MGTAFWLGIAGYSIPMIGLFTYYFLSKKAKTKITDTLTLLWQRNN